MKVLVIGTPTQTEELQQILPETADITIAENIATVEHAIPHFPLIFDLAFDESPNRLAHYDKAKATVFAGAVCQSLAQATHDHSLPTEVTLIGMNTLPTMINRPSLECSVLQAADQAHGEEIAAWIGRPINWVADRVGMVTPRIVLMLINEACYTHQEGTATKADIDLGMKLGTAYPRGPLAWADAIGIERVHQSLLAMLHDTHDERYRISPLLQRHFLTRTPITD